MNDEEFMRAAIEKVRAGIREGQTPFGACLGKDGEIIACEHNEVWKNTNITDHAEVRAIEVACEKLGTVDLSGLVMYTTCEPCPMCFSACHWANISKIVFGARIDDAKGMGFSELTIPNEKMKEIGNSPMEITADFMKEECLALFREYAEKADRKVY